MHSPSWEANRFSPVKKFPKFYGTRRYIISFRSAHHLSQSSARLTQSMPKHPTSWRSILILSSYLCLGLPSGLFPSGFPTKILYALLFFTAITCLIHLILLEAITRIITNEEHRPRSFSLCSPLQAPVTLSLLPNTIFSTLLSNSLALYSWVKFLNVK